MNFSFSKEYRLLKPRDFQYLRRGASRIDTPFLRFYFKKSQNMELGHARLGLSISKKAGNAVHRNFIKRRCREVFRSSFLRTSPLEVLVIASPRLKKLKGSEYKDAVNSSLAKALRKGNGPGGFFLK